MKILTCSTENRTPDIHLDLRVSYSVRSVKFLNAISTVPSYNRAERVKMTDYNYSD